MWKTKYLIVKITMVCHKNVVTYLFLTLRFISLQPNSQVGWPHLFNCTQVLIQYVCSHCLPSAIWRCTIHLSFVFQTLVMLCLGGFSVESISRIFRMGRMCYIALRFHILWNTVPHFVYAHTHTHMIYVRCTNWSRLIQVVSPCCFVFFVTGSTAVSTEPSCCSTVFDPYFWLISSLNMSAVLSTCLKQEATCRYSICNVRVQQVMKSICTVWWHCFATVYHVWVDWYVP
jgi:hypothetical protein